MIKFIIITPAKDEEQYIEFTLKTVIKQSILPIEWVIIDDGSIDQTYEIAKKYAFNNIWIKVYKIPTMYDERSGGAKVVRAFNYGLGKVESKIYDYIVKLDADISLQIDYFEKVFKAFSDNPKLGLCGGYCINETNGKTIREKSAQYHIRGAFKTYRKECFQDIGGLKQVWNWDGLDEMTAIYKGWETKVLEIGVIHHRPTSNAYNLYRHSFKSGENSFQTGNDLGLTIIRCIVRLKQKPYLIGGILFLAGFLTALFSKKEKLVDKNLARFIRNFHYKRIFNNN